MIKRRRILVVIILLLGLWALFAGNVNTSVKAAPSGAPGIGDCTVFPPDNPWNRDVSNDPVDANSDTYIHSLNQGGDHLRIGFGQWLEWGIPYVVVSGDQPKVPITFTDYSAESDPGPYPVPLNAPVEGNHVVQSDKHVIAVDKDNCMLYELYNANFNGVGWTASSGAVYNLRENTFRPEGWTSADAAGLPIFPGLVRYDEVSTGAINHALRFTVAAGGSQGKYVFPARHFQNQNKDASLPPFGLRVRLKANYDISKFTGHTRVILEALKKYGMILADESNASWYISGTSTALWDRRNLDELNKVPGSAFEVVQPQYSPVVQAKAAETVLKLQTRTGNPKPTGNVIHPFFRIVNNGTGYARLSELKIRYWFTRDTAQPIQLDCEHAIVDCDNITAKIVQMKPALPGAEYYVEIGFTDGAGYIAPMSDSGPIEMRISKPSDWSDFNELDDYSYAGNRNFTDATRSVLYRYGAIIGGTEPAANTATSTPTDIPMATSTTAPTNTPKPTNTPAPTFQPPTNTPVAATGGSSGDVPATAIPNQPNTPMLGIQYREVETDPFDTRIGAFVRLINMGGGSVSYSELRLRYWFTRDSAAKVNFFCDWAAIGCNNVIGNVVLLDQPLDGADAYLEVGFMPSTGVLASNTNSGDLQLRLVKNDWSPFDETNDYSHDLSKSQFALWTKMTLYRNGVKVWGAAPSPVTGPVITNTPAPTNTARPPIALPAVQYMPGENNVSDPHIAPFFKIVNNGGVSVSYSELKLRYWFVRDSNVPLNFYCDWAAVGCENITGTIVKLAHPLNGADTYLEIGFTPRAGWLDPGRDTDQIQVRIVQKTWDSFDESNDYSFDGSKTAYAYSSKITLYRNNALVWGNEPPPADSGN